MADDRPSRPSRAPTARWFGGVGGGGLGAAIAAQVKDYFLLFTTLSAEQAEWWGTTTLIVGMLVGTAVGAYAAPRDPP